MACVARVIDTFGGDSDCGCEEFIESWWGEGGTLYIDDSAVPGDCTNSERARGYDPLGRRYDVVVSAAQIESGR